MDTQFDTAGEVICPMDGGGWPRNEPIRWSDLAPFQQGYVEAMLTGDYRFNPAITIHIGQPKERLLGFSDIAPETIQRIIEDCTNVLEIIDSYVDEDIQRNSGRGFWNARSNGNWTARQWPPLTLTLGEDGKVRFV